MILHPIIDLLKRIVIALPDYAGGGGGEWEYIDTFTASDVNTIWITIPEEYRDAKAFALIGELLPSSTDWGKVGINGTFSGYGGKGSSNQLPVYATNYTLPDDTTYTIATSTAHTTKKSPSVTINSIGVGLFTASNKLSGDVQLYALR